MPILKMKTVRQGRGSPSQTVVELGCEWRPVVGLFLGTPGRDWLVKEGCPVLRAWAVKSIHLPCFWVLDLVLLYVLGPGQVTFGYQFAHL